MHSHYNQPQYGIYEMSIMQQIFTTVLIASSLLLSITVPALLHAEPRNTGNLSAIQVQPKGLFAPNPSPQAAQPLIIRQTDTLSLDDSIGHFLKRYKINPDQVSIYIRDINADKPLLMHNADIQRTPASTMKLFTTFAALKTLGPTYRWKTEAWVRGTLKDGVLEGDLILKGYGDPFLVHERYWKFIHDLRDKGLKTIKGNVIIDNSYFDIPPINPAAFDQTPHRIYNAPPAALMYNFQATRFLFNTDKDTQSVTIQAFPALDADIKLDNQVKFSRGKCRKVHYRPTFNYQKNGDLRVRGAYSSACGQQFILRNVTQPKQLAFNTFKQLWGELGGHLHGSLVAGRVDRSQDKRLHLYQSPPLGEQIRTINKWSNNVMTRQLLLSLGAEKYGAPATLEKGRQAIIAVLKSVGVANTEAILIENGSGLSRIAHFSAQQMASLLAAAYYDPYMPEFLASLSLAGMDGTLYKRFKKGDLKGRAHLKTGTINGVSTISGYLLSRQGKRFIIVIQQNGGRGAVALQNDILRWTFEQ